MLNTEHFVLLAGNPEKWDEETRVRVAQGESLPNIQISQHSQGRCGIELVSTLLGWSIRYSSGLDDRAILWGSRMAGRRLEKEEVIEYGKNWVAQDPDRREFFARKDQL